MLQHVVRMDRAASEVRSLLQRSKTKAERLHHQLGAEPSIKELHDIIVDIFQACDGELKFEQDILTGLGYHASAAELQIIANAIRGMLHQIVL